MPKRFWKSRIVITTSWTGYYLPYLCEKWKWPLVSLTLIFSASYWPKFKSKDSFEILRTSRFQNWPSVLNLVKIWGSYCQKTNWKVFFGTPCSLSTSFSLFLMVCKRLISRICVNGGWGNVLNFPEKHGNLFNPLGYNYKCQESH